MVGILTWLKRPFAPLPPKPRTSDGAGGAGSRQSLWRSRSGTSDALFPEEVQSFLDNFFARLGHGSVDNALLAPLAPCSDAPAAGHRHPATFYSLFVELRLCLSFLH